MSSDEIWLAISAGFLVLFSYPFAIYPLVLKWLPRRPVLKAATGLKPSLLFCAHNEVNSLPPKIENLRRLSQQDPELEILVFDDCSTDGTAKLLEANDDILTLVRGKEQCGKAGGMKQLASMATGDILIFTDANVLFDDAAINNLLAYYADKHVGGVCGTLIYQDDAPSVTTDVNADYWIHDENLRSLESATGNVMGADGSIFSIRRDLYPEFPHTVLDDMVVSMSVIFAGYRLVSAPDAHAFERGVAEHKDEVRRKIRIGARAYHTHSHIRGNLRRMEPVDKFKYISRKMMRWFSGLFLGAAIVSGLIGLALMDPWTAFIAVALGVAVLSVSLYWRRGLLGRAATAFTLIFATLYGVMLGASGKTFVTWTPAKSR